MKKVFSFLIIGFMISLLFSCKQHAIILGTTTSTDNSGLLDYLMPYFEKDEGINVKWVAVGTGAALEMGRNGEADILMVHAKSLELEFMEDGYGSKRSDLMYNDFVIVGPEDKVVNTSSLEALLTDIKDKGYDFISRGDNSGTHTKELSLWDKFNVEPSGDWYIESGQGMGSTLTVANEKLAYTLTDRATYLNMKDDLDLKIIFEGDPDLFNQYGIILVNPKKHKNINYDDALVLYNWLLSDRAQELINEYGKEEFGDSLFTGNAPKE